MSQWFTHCAASFDPCEVGVNCCNDKVSNLDAHEGHLCMPACYILHMTDYSPNTVHHSEGTNNADKCLGLHLVA